ncbi:PIN-like domain-containing protein [Phanerochaete sordida]|uniref:PIN-like domain-containing protein n=1 Tax=Phanerochaete sordida TaxID=48140 RepID=A0A9P3LIA3_9APHY|nr:PIN-like domain-containing protein [Phanerochaete sordida]
MGVQGLWEILEPAGQSRSLTKVAVVDGFEGNESGKRGYRVGVDASIWYQHAEHSTKAGANPELRLLFFRLARLAKLPWLVLFVFDGRERPNVKRGSKMGKSGSHNLTQGFKEMIECFGMEWRMARGEAEAELAYLNAQGIIDAIITDDVDALVFGARTLIRNSGATLTGNRNNPATDASGKQSDQHSMVYTSDRIASHPNIGLTRGGMVLIALLSGGDYDSGVKGLGPKIAHGLARCGFGDRLLSAYRMGEAEFKAFLPQWRNELNSELCTNASGMLPHRCSSAAVSSSWPDMLTLTAYCNPVCSALNGQGTLGLALRDRGDLSLPRLAKFCEDHFDEWGHRSRILERFHNFMYEGAVFHVLRRAALEVDEKEKNKRLLEGRPGHIREPLCPVVDEAVGTPASLVQRYLDPAKTDLRQERLADIFVNRGTPRASTSAVNIPDTHPLIESVVGKRTHLSTDSLFEYRVVVRCKQLDDLTSKGITGKHPEPPPNASQNLPDEDGIYGTGGAKSKKPINRSTKRIWVAASIMRQVHPELVERFEVEGPPRVARRKQKARAVGGDDDGDDSDSSPEFGDEPSSPAKSQPMAVSATRQPAASQGAITRIPATPTRRTSHPLPRPRLLHNVGDINFEESTNRNTFIFTFSDPCDPSMVLSDDEDSGFPEFVVGPSSQPVQPQSGAPPFRDDPVNDDEPFPAIFSARQEAIIDRALGLDGGGGSSRASVRKGPQQPRRAAGNATSRPSRVDTPNASVPIPPRPAASQPRRPVALPASQPNPRTNALYDDEPMPTRFTATQEAMIDRALGIPGGSSSSAAARKPKPKRTAAAAGTRAGSNLTSAVLPGGGDDPGFDEPMPMRYSMAQEAIIDRALGLAGGNSKRPKAASTRKRTQPSASQPSAESQQAKRRRVAAAAESGPPSASLPPLSSSQPSAPAPSAPARRPLAPFPDLPPLNNPNDRSYSGHAPSRAPLARGIPKERSIIDISDDEHMVKRAPQSHLTSRTGGWGTHMPSSSQESRLTDIDFDLT